MDAKNAGRKTDWGRELFYLWFFTKAFFFPFHPSQNSSLFLRGSLTLKRLLYEKKRWMYILCSGMCLGVKLVFLFFFHCMTWERKEIFFLPSSFLPSSILSSLLPFFPSLLLLTCIKFRSFYYHHHHLAFSLSSRLSSLLSLIFLPSFQPFSILSSLTLSYLPSFLSLSWSLSLSLSLCISFPLDSLHKQIIAHRAVWLLHKKCFLEWEKKMVGMFPFLPFPLKSWNRNHYCCNLTLPSFSFLETPVFTKEKGWDHLRTVVFREC